MKRQVLEKGTMDNPASQADTVSNRTGAVGQAR